MSKAVEAGKTFLSGILAKVTDPGAKAHVEALMADQTFLTEVGGGALGQSEVSRQLQDLATRTQELNDRQAVLDEQQESLTTYRGTLDSWYEGNKDTLSVGIAAKKAGWKPGATVPPNGTGNPPVTTPPAGTLTEEQFNERMTGERLAFLGFTADANEIQREHFGKFNEIIDIRPLLVHPQIKDLGLKGVYGLVHKERLDKHATDTQKAHDDKLREEGAAAARAAMAQMPYPSPTGAGSDTSPLSGLTGSKPDALVDQAVAEYTRLQQQRGASA